MSVSRLPRRVASALITAVAAGAAVTAAGGAVAAAPAMAAIGSMGPAIYTQPFAGYEAGGGRWFRFISTTLTLEPPQASSGGPIAASISLQHGGLGGSSYAALTVLSTGGRIMCSCGGSAFDISPSYGDQLALSIYYDRHGHDYFTVTDLTQNVSQTVREAVPAVVYDGAGLLGEADGVMPPSADVRQWHFTSSHLTTYTGVHGTITGPWTTSKVIATSDGTASGVVVQSPSRLYDGGQNFGVWLRHQ